MRRIDISFLNRPDLGNILGLAYGPLHGIFMTHCSNIGERPKDAFVYVLDADGRLLETFNFRELYGDLLGIGSLSFFGDELHLRVAREFIHISPPSLVTVDPEFKEIVRELPLPIGAGSVHVREDGIWCTSFANDLLWHLSSEGSVEQEYSLKESFGGYPGPGDITSYDQDGLLVVDSKRQFVLEFDLTGKERRAALVTRLSDCYPESIDVSHDTESVFLSLGNSEIAVVSLEELFEETVPLKRHPEREDAFVPKPVVSYREWTESRIEGFAKRVLEEVRDRDVVKKLPQSRLPKWMDHASVRTGWINAGAIIVIEEGLGSDDCFKHLGPVATDTCVLFDLGLRGSQAAYMDISKCGELVMASNLEEQRPVIVLPYGAAWWSLGWGYHHGPLAVYEFTFQMNSELGNTPWITRHVPVAFYLSSSHPFDEDDLIQRFVDHTAEELSRFVKSPAGEATELRRSRVSVLTTSREKTVMVLGSFATEHMRELRAIRDCVASKGYDGVLLSDLPDMPGMTNDQKARLYTQTSRFCIMVDRKGGASGHLREYEFLFQNRTITALCRPKEGGSTSMIGDEPGHDINYIRLFEFDDSPHEIIEEATEWAEGFAQLREANLRQSPRT